MRDEPASEPAARDPAGVAVSLEASPAAPFRGEARLSSSSSSSSSSGGGVGGVRLRLSRRRAAGAPGQAGPPPDGVSELEGLLALRAPEPAAAPAAKPAAAETEGLGASGRRGDGATPSRCDPLEESQGGGGPAAAEGALGRHSPRRKLKWKRGQGGEPAGRVRRGRSPDGAAPRGVSSGGGSAPRGVSSGGGSAPRGVSSGGGSAPRGVSSSSADHLPREKPGASLHGGGSEEAPRAGDVEISADLGWGAEWALGPERGRAAEGPPPDGVSELERLFALRAQIEEAALQARAAALPPPPAAEHGGDGEPEPPGVGAPGHAAPPLMGGGAWGSPVRPVRPARARDETCPVSTGRGTRRVQSVREGGGGGGGARDPERQGLQRSPQPLPRLRARGGGGARGEPRDAGKHEWC